MILASLKPYYYYLVGEGIKEVEVRKSMPKSSDWDKKVLFYMSKDEKSFAKIPKEFQEKYRKHFGKVGMRFVCDRIYEIRNLGSSFMIGNDIALTNRIARESCLDYDDMIGYLGNKYGYGWHISDLKIYDKPKDLGEFFVKGECPEENCGFCKNFHRGRGWLNGDTYDENDCIAYGIKPITRPPQSWFYVEEL